MDVRRGSNPSLSVILFEAEYKRLIKDIGHVSIEAVYVPSLLADGYLMLRREERC